MDELLQTITSLLLTGINLLTGIVIGYGVLEAVARLAKNYRQPQSPHFREGIRIELGQWLALGLEFSLAADILATVVAPSWKEIGKLAAIATIRTVLNFFLQRELENLHRRS